jgi:IS30 family transposase
MAGFQTSTEDYGSDFTAKVVREWLARLGVETLCIEPGGPWENGYVESFDGKLRGELLDREIFYTLQEAQVLIERWRQHYNRFRPHSSLGYRPSAPEAIEIGPLGMVSLPLAVAQGLTGGADCHGGQVSGGWSIDEIPGAPTP